MARADEPPEHAKRQQPGESLSRLMRANNLKTLKFPRGTDSRNFAEIALANTASGSTTSGASASGGETETLTTWR